jgi:flagellar basal-body rod protein FlgB
MIDALFNQPNYVAAKRVLDVTAMRMEAVSSNLANIETPGYRRVELPASFEAQLRQAIGEGQAQQVAQLRPYLVADPNAVALRPDGNTVDLETEMVNMYRASMEHAVETHLITGALMKMRLAITGRPS